MAEKTLVQIIGTGATRLAAAAAAPGAGLFIPDSLFIAAGLPDPTTATAEAHIAALIKLLKETLTQAAFDADTDAQIYIENGFDSFTTRGTSRFRVRQLTINMAELDSGATIDPTKY